mmetsp:Transcript_9200/g.20392  ORF Transcript_9200/g.20392 Transcript_9200/m.20392 type:complete len:96 (-) Transcript_9200:61-348(-)
MVRPCNGHNHIVGSNSGSLTLFLGNSFCLAFWLYHVFLSIVLWLLFPLSSESRFETFALGAACQFTACRGARLCMCLAGLEKALGKDVSPARRLV